MSYFLSPTVAFPLDFLASIFLAQKCYSSSSLASSIQALLLWAAIPALIPKAQSRRQINSMLPGEKCFCILWMTQMCSMVMTGHHRNFTSACPRNCQKSLKRKAAAAEQAILQAGGAACSSDPRSHAKSSGYEMATVLEDATFCSFVYLITMKVRKQLLWKGIMRLLRHENQRSTGMTWWKLRA